MRRPPARLRPTRLLAALPVLALLLGTLSCAGPFGAGTMHVTAYFHDSAGLFVGNDVGILGVPVGKVDSITPDGDLVKVEMSVDDDHPVPADAGAVIVARSVATDRYVELTPVYKSGPRLGDGAVIPASRTKTPVDFDQVLDSLNTLATGLTSTPQARNAVKRLVDAADSSLGGKGGLLHDTITSVAGATTAVAAQRKQLVDTLLALDDVVKVINKNRDVEGRFLHQVSTASSLLASQRVQFRTSVRALEQVVGDLARFQARNGAKITATLQDTNSLTRFLIGQQGSLKQTLRLLPLALQNVELANHGGTLPVRLDPLELVGIGSILQQVCGILPGNLCEVVDGTGLVSSLLGLLGIGGGNG